MKKILILVGILLITGTGIIYGTDIFQDVEVIQKRVIFDSRYFAGTEGYYAVGQQIQAEKQQQALNQQNIEIAELKALIKALCEKLGGTEHANPVPTQPETKPVPTPKIETLNDKVTILFKAKCYNCHKNDANGFKMFDDTGNVNVTFEEAEFIHHRTEGLGLEPGEALMPKGSQPLNNEEMILIKKWLHSKNPKLKK